MNNVSLVGRFVRDPEVRYTAGNNPMAVAKFTIAVDRRAKTQDGQGADFISCLAFGKTAEFIEKYFRKGMRIGLAGRIQTGSYTNKEGNKVYTTEVLAETVEFVESKGSGGGGNSGYAPNNATQDNGFMNIPDGIDEELPFN